MKTPKIFIWENGARILIGMGQGCYQGSQIWLEGCTLSVRATQCAVRRIELVWDWEFPADARVLGDQWERGYGQLGWRRPDPDAVMPWYFLAWTEEKTHCFGVKTEPNALCWWQTDGQQVSLFADISCGNAQVCLDGQELPVCEVVMETYAEDPCEAACRFCHRMCPAPRMPAGPVYGGNDWYCNYGDSSYEKIITHTRRIVECSPENGPRPYMVIDDGWELCHHPEHSEKEFFNGGPWRYCNRNFGDMKKLAAEITRIGAIPGIWFRPLWTTEKFPERYILKYREMKYTLDPSVPEVLEIVRQDVACLRNWGYRLIKHDFSTFDLFGKWGNDPKAFPDMDITFADRTKTTAQIIRTLYQTIREAAGEDVLIIGCNTLSHLSAGIFEIQRTGDDTSGLEWERTKTMGINTLAFRMCQHGAFYACDADCVGITRHISWETNRKWLDVLSKSGTPLFVSIGEDAYSDRVKADIRSAFARAAVNLTPSRPLDWMESGTPTRWQSAFGTESYDWEETPADGA